MRFQTQFRTLLTLNLLLMGATAFAQTTQPTGVTPAPAKAASPAPVTTSVAPRAGVVAASGLTSPSASATAITVNRAIKGQFLNCPANLKVSQLAVCLYVKAASSSLQPAIKSSLGNLVLGDWKTAGKASSLLVRESADGKLGAFVLLSALTPTESLVVIDGITLKAAAKPAAPAGVVKGQPYLLDRDLAGVVNVVNLGGGKYRLNVAGQTAITITSGSKTAQRAGGNVDLPLAPVSDGKNLIYPVSGLRALGCTTTDAGKGITIACGPDSVGITPIVFQ
ncbi:hypothetical protein [Deinococcus sp.]|uniref:hypothetical protein n=1 Tax=Deinococcus sp. TaxID=47478 RepID=UPI0025C5E949|nr:hypothetical protein [Deinococcus sp.]